MTGQPRPESGEIPDPIRGIDTSRPHPARIYDYWLGGTDNFAADRDAAERVLAVLPPGVVPLGQWALDPPAGAHREQSALPSYAALARKP